MSVFWFTQKIVSIYPVQTNFLSVYILLYMLHTYLLISRSGWMMVKKQKNSKKKEGIILWLLVIFFKVANLLFITLDFRYFKKNCHQIAKFFFFNVRIFVLCACFVIILLSYMCVCLLKNSFFF